MNEKFFADTDTKQITFLDSRFYTNDDENYFPSVTHVLDVYPKGFGFNEWLKDVGSNAKIIAERAAESGSKIHAATEELNKGRTITWEASAYSREEWQMLLKFVNFWELTKPELLANEISMCSPTLRYGGTIDRVVNIFGKRWLVDIKTGNYLHKSQELQLAAYAKMWNEKFPDDKIDHTGILWLKSSVRTEKIDPDKMIFQGKGWQLKGFERPYESAFKIFQHTQAIWEEENPVWKPLNLIYPMEIKL